MHSNSDKEFNQHYRYGKYFVLIVDNDKDNLFLVSCVVESMGMDCAVCDDSEHCLDLIRELLPDIVLLDIVMPKVSGLEIAASIKQDEDLARIPLLAVTGLTKAEDKDRLMAAGFDDYLSKPYLIDELEAKLSKLLNLPQA
ncbi:MAG: response regulator [Cyanobacteria bacterium P01_G01_bin.19]